MASNHSPEIRENPAADEIKRFAIDPAGRLGSLYDGYRDCALGQLTVKNTTASYPPFKPAKCQNIKGDSNFHYVHGEERLDDNVSEIRGSIHQLISQTNATHIITGVSWGLRMVAILQLPPEKETVEKIDDILEKIRISLESDQIDLTLKTNEQSLLKTIRETKIYSNASELTRMNTFYDACCYINRFKINIMRYPITYTLQPLSTSCTGQRIPFFSVPPALASKIVNDLLLLSSTIKNLEISIDDDLQKVLCKYLKGQLYDVHIQWTDVNRKYMNEIERLSKLLQSYHYGHSDINKFKHELENNEKSILKQSVSELTKNRKALEAKGRLITDLQPFKYCNVADRDVDKADTRESIEQKLIIDKQHDRVLCTDDYLNTKNPNELLRLRRQLVEEYEKDPTLRLIYADFTYSSFQFFDMMILPSNQIANDKCQPEQNNTSTPAIVQPSPRTNDIINILLIGETGVGKSTFINAFANYLTFNSLQTAESNKPVVLIPVSFIITAGDNFDEHIVELNNVYKSDTENFNTFGQSVTQYCKSYLLHLKNNEGRKLRIIDTPGFGDTRGIKQDDQNMQHILEYINSLTHLDAVCFLLKPNTEKLNVFFRSCITQLLDHLGQDARENIIFCFTNARTTFYTPGDTSPLLRNMLNLISMGKIPFKKENTFCFDSESFRYLVALQKNIPFKDLDKTEYENSWLMSAKESNRLLDYICNNLTTYHMQRDKQSIKNIQFEIMHMIHPMLETIRNILRNILLWTPDSSYDLIELQPKAIYRLATRCLTCRPYHILVGKFGILPDSPHEIQEKCLICSCAPDQHTPIEYILKYECSAGLLSFEEMHNLLSPILEAIVEFAHFLKHVAHSIDDDPFKTGLTRMIEEEKDISEKIRSNDLNLQLVQQLENVIRDYERRMDEMKTNQWDNNLSLLYNKIKAVSEHSIISKQMAVIKQGQERMMEQHEYTC